ncbi:MAG: DUF2227 family putative metal-binding protein [Synechococcaceae cyanobacterium]|nr:DUF2227 family putative metal-binding protein [Synechococcaceae cyanobacterium]
MASGRSHDRATGLLALPFGLLCWPWLGAGGGLMTSLAFLVGGLWLSPDLDTGSNAWRRWGPLRPLWWPYRRLLRHRSLLSHSPVLGSAGRLTYLLAWLLLLGWLLQPLGAPSPGQQLQLLQRLWQEERPLLLGVLAAIEASAWLHLLQDGDPELRAPRLLRGLQRRRGSGRRRRPLGPGRGRRRRRAASAERRRR